MADEVDTTGTASFIGRGFDVPSRVDHAGSLALVTGGTSIERAMRMVLGTAPGERVMRPDFGCAIWDLLFEPINDNTLGLMAEAVREALDRWEPRAEVTDVQVTPLDDAAGHVAIAVAYTVRATNDRRNLVFPFYTIPGEGESA